MSENLQIQLLGADDVAALRGMLDMFGTAFEDVEHYTSRQPDDAWLRDLLASTTFVAAAAFAGGRVVGGIAGYLLTKFEQARPRTSQADAVRMSSSCRPTGAMIRQSRSTPDSARAQTCCISTFRRVRPIELRVDRARLRSS